MVVTRIETPSTISIRDVPHNRESIGERLKERWKSSKEFIAKSCF